MSHAVPADYQLVTAPEGFIGHNGPYYWRRDSAGRIEFGFQSDQRHSNPNGVLHGGAVLGFLDTILGHVVVQETGKRCATVALDGRFVAATPSGQWITGRVTARKVTRSLAFLDAEATAGGTLLVTATAIFRVFDDG
jgi:acyl-coenzyme A thioesterase PaaI-like protein